MCEVALIFFRRFSSDFPGLISCHHLTTFVNDNEHPQIHVAEYLLERGANSALADHEGLTAFDLALMDKQTTLDLNPLSSPSDVYAWGANANFNLGIRDVNQYR